MSNDAPGGNEWENAEEHPNAKVAKTVIRITSEWALKIIQ
jgi:hypothetical protein